MNQPERLRSPLFLTVLSVLLLAFVSSSVWAKTFKIKKVEWNSEENKLKIEGVGEGENDTTVTVVNAFDVSQVIGSDKVDEEGKWKVKQENPSPVPCRIQATLQPAGTRETRDVSNAPADCAPTDTAGGGTTPPPGGGTPPPVGGTPPPVGGVVSINSTSQNGVLPNTPVMQQNLIIGGQQGFQVFAANDLGMHCGDLDTRISSILPPFNIFHAQVIQKGAEPSLLGPNQASVFYSGASNPADPVLGRTPENNLLNPPANNPNQVYKTNFWDTLATGAYDPFYPPVVTPLSSVPDLGLPVPDPQVLPALSAAQQSMPGINDPYNANAPQRFKAFIANLPFFRNFAFGYTAQNLKLHEAAGMPATGFDDFGRENAFPLMRAEARVNGSTVATTDFVFPISGEANCQACHAAPDDPTSFKIARINGSGTTPLGVVASSFDDTLIGTVPLEVSVEYASDINLLKLHDLKVSSVTLITGTTMDPDMNTRGSKPFKPVVCQVCHYSPALDLAQVGPLGPENDPINANGRDQVKNQSMSRVMHYFHGTLTASDGSKLFPVMPSPVGRDSVQAQNTLQQTCYLCHPGRRTQCLRGAMGDAGIVCQDCHGQMTQVGNDFSRNVTPANPGAFEVAADFYTNPATPRVPWANEPTCGSCHTGDALSNLAGTGGTITNVTDTTGVPDGIRLVQAYLTGDSKATPILPTNKRFAETPTGTGPAATGNPRLFRLSNGHKGVFCEGCHGSTHGIWPARPGANDNVTATQLQGHTGKIVECAACHTGDLGITLDGPHGIHPIGVAGLKFADGGHEKLAEKNKDDCRACHGQNGGGTVLAKVAVDRTFTIEECDKGTLCPGGKQKPFTVNLKKDDVIACTLCHENKL